MMWFFISQQQGRYFFHHVQCQSPLKSPRSPSASGAWVREESEYERSPSTRGARVRVEPECERSPSTRGVRVREEPECERSPSQEPRKPTALLEPKLDPTPCQEKKPSILINYFWYDNFGVCHVIFPPFPSVVFSVKILVFLFWIFFSRCLFLEVGWFNSKIASFLSFLCSAQLHMLISHSAI